MKKNKIFGALYLSLAASIWGGMFVVVKVVVAFIPPVELVWLRYLIAVVVLFAIGCAQHIDWHVKRKDWPLILLIGVIGNALSIVTQEAGTWLSSAQLGSVITAATPTFMILFAWWLLKERLTWAKIASVALATIGVLMIVGVHAIGAGNLLGAVFLMIAALTWAFMSVLIKLVPDDYPPVQVTTLATATALVCLSPIVLMQRSTVQWHYLTQPKIIVCLLYLGVISTAIAFVMWNRGLRLMNAAGSGLFFVFQPFVGTLLGWLILGEAIGFGFWAGVLLISASIWITIRYSD
jgi:drug/metabolite transporter (DMT)-like permease